MLHSLDVESSRTIEEACDRFRGDIRHWIDHCIGLYAGESATDIHDQATYTTSWSSSLRGESDRRKHRFLTDLRDDISEHFHNTGQWHHGYWKRAEAHHGTEHTELFLGAMMRIDPGDDVTAAMIVDVAEHVSGWWEEVAPWFDWESGLFYSMWQGTDNQSVKGELRLNVPDHLRLINIALMAFEITSDRHYLDLIKAAVRPWTEAITADSALPVVVLPDKCIVELDRESDQQYRSFAGEAPALTLQVDRAENFLACNGIMTFLKTWEHVKDPCYLSTAIRLLDVMASQLTDPGAGPACDILRTFGSMTQDGRYHGSILDAARSIPRNAVSVLSIDTERGTGNRSSGIGKRSDMPVWLEDGHPRTRNPILLSTVAQIEDDESCAIESVDLARTYFNLARDVFPDGRDHGCSARSVSAVARGHGRDNNAGMVTAVLDPIEEHFIRGIAR